MEGTEITVEFDDEPEMNDTEIANDFPFGSDNIIADNNVVSRSISDIADMLSSLNFF